MRARFALFAAVAFVLVVGSATAVAAASADSEGSPFEVDVGTTVSGVCPFDIALSAHLRGTTNVVAIANDQHVGIEIDIRESDTLTGPNGVPLVSEPYESIEHVGFDDETGDGHDFGSGHVARFLLPDGSTFLSAVRVTAVGGSVIAPDFGHSGTIEALCAALD